MRRPYPILHAPTHEARVAAIRALMSLGYYRGDHSAKAAYAEYVETHAVNYGAYPYIYVAQGSIQWSPHQIVGPSYTLVNSLRHMLGYLGPVPKEGS